MTPNISAQCVHHGERISQSRATPATLANSEREKIPVLGSLLFPFASTWASSVWESATYMEG